jgi:hypothetical protein
MSNWVAQGVKVGHYLFNSLPAAKNAAKYVPIAAYQHAQLAECSVIKFFM